MVSTVCRESNRLTALKTLSMYLRAAKTEAEDAGISTEGMADSVSQLREELMALTGGKVDIMSDAEAGSYKSTVEILRELSQVWNDLSDTSRTNITELIGGGVRNANIISALMNNFSIVEDAMATSAESSGSALAENEKYLDSINGKIQQFKASYETLSTTMFDSDLIKFAVTAGTALVDAFTFVADNFGSVLAALTTGSVVGSISNITDLIKGLDKEKGLGKFLTTMKESGSGIAGGSKLTLLQIRPPHRDGNIERVARQGDAKQMARGLYLDKWCT